MSRPVYRLILSAPMTYEVRLYDGTIAGYVKRGRTEGPRGGSVPTWNGWSLVKGRPVFAIADYTGSRAVAANAVVRTYMEATS